MNAAVDHRIQVLEVRFSDLIRVVPKKFNVHFQVSGSNVVSVAEHVIMSILLLVRNFVPAHEVSFSEWSVF